MNTLKLISPTVLYPMTTIDSINPETLKRVTQEARNGGEIPTIKVLEFKGYYIILDGVYEMIAANRVGKQQISVEIVPWESLNNWLSEKNIEKQLSIIGMNALYDIEALGGFTYNEYPAFYKKG